MSGAEQEAVHLWKQQTQRAEGHVHVHVWSSLSQFRFWDLTVLEKRLFKRMKVYYLMHLH